MTETRELDVIFEALAVIDRGLGELTHRELVSTDEVANLLLDVRSLLTSNSSLLTSDSGTLADAAPASVN